MKHIISTILISIFLISNAEHSITAPIKNVTVYKKKAKIYRKKNTTIKSGTKEIKISGLSPKVDKNTIQAKILGNATLLSTSFSINYLEELKESKQYSVMNDSLKLLNDQISVLDYQKNVLDGEAKLIEQNNKLGGETNGFTVDELTKLSVFYSKRMLEIKKSSFDNSKKRQKLIATKNRIQRWLNSNRVKKNPVGEITLKIEALSSANIDIECQYLVNNAGWTPIYDIRAKNTKEDIHLEYKANVYQNTGIEWKDLPLTISTGNPSSYSIKPNLNTLFVNIYKPYTYRNERIASNKIYKTTGSVDRGGSYESEDVEMLAYDTAPIMKKEKALTVETNTNTLTVEYEIKNLQTIKSNGQIHLVKLNKMDIPTKFEHHAIPKLSKSVFLQAKLSDWGQYNLVPAQASIFFEGMYIGKTYLNPLATTDTMQISLGIDHNVQIKRIQLNDYKSKKLIGTKRMKTIAYNIEVKNNKTTPISLIIEDQYPVSQNSEIEVELLENGGATENKRNGKLTWKENISPNNVNKHTFAYSVKYPKNQKITNVR